MRQWLFYSALAYTLLAVNGHTAVAEPLKGLILTSPGVYHDYENQTRTLARGIARHMDIRFDVSLAELQRWQSTDYAAAYDLLVYNICMADNQNAQLIANMRRQTEILGVPALFIHCTMHSFRGTDQWWPLLGLQTKSHEALRPLPQTPLTEHPVLLGIPATWTVATDELYRNLDFAGEALLSSAGEMSQPHTTTWIGHAGTTRIFGTTLGHSDDTLADPTYQRLLANAAVYVTGETAAARIEPDSEQYDVIGTFSAPAGVRFLDEDGRSCAMRALFAAAAPCFLGCMLHPFEWGEDTEVCKQACEAELPGSDELMQDCMSDI